MPALFGQAFWPGVNGFISCEYTCSQGNRPSIASLEIPEQDTSGIAGFGTLVLTDGVNEIRLDRARVVDCQSLGGGGQQRSLVLHIADRRWMNSYGTISGKFNQVDPYPDPNAPVIGPDGEAIGAYIPGTERTATELIRACFDELNIENFHIDPPPSQPVSVQWEDESPGNAMQEVTDAVGYRICFQPSLDRYLVCPIGSGRELPLDLPIMSSNPGIALPGAPGAIEVVGGESYFHDLLPLEAIGLEADGTVRAIDQLSYRPAAGWTTVGPWFDGVQKGASESVEESNRLAREHVFKTFRVRHQNVGTLVDGPLDIAGYGPVKDRRQLVLHDRQMFPNKKMKNGRPLTAKSFVIGSVLLSRLRGVNKVPAGDRFGNTSPDEALPLEYAIDQDRGFVRFSDYVVRRSDDKKVAAPVLYLFTAFQILEFGKLTPVRYRYRSEPLGVVPECPQEIVMRPELHEIIFSHRKGAKPTGPETKWVFDETETNRNELLPPAKFHAGAAKLKYALGAESQDISYSGVLPIDPDGAIQQVTWRVGGGQPAITRASRNTEHALELPRFPERRRLDKMLQIFRLSDQKDKSNDTGPLGKPGAR